ncbi:hypothetical protein KGA66_08380 [Actinocrinis puniceicyclus]|uniref:Uncharacterized protein n=1 Tax=Actinocrinis puniceicyclus TaxID=977794 RepID=A0A8J7WMU8_9ACTN|nr:hypothetical protein [Actinocrinis puniceicyclus]MBS2963057.1 hypothetical protein [Actinocrinis puniceicyclus]
MSTTDLFGLPVSGHNNPSDARVRSNAMYQPHLQLAQELHRERLRQAEEHRVRRVALRARRALVQQLMR